MGTPQPVMLFLANTFPQFSFSPYIHWTCYFLNVHFYDSSVSTILRSTFQTTKTFFFLPATMQFINQHCLFTAVQLSSLLYYHAFSRNPIPVFVSLIWHACTFVLTFCNAHSYFPFLFISCVFLHWCLGAYNILIHTSCFLSCITESFSP